MALTHSQFKAITRIARAESEPPSRVAVQMGFKRYDYSNFKARMKAKATAPRGVSRAATAKVIDLAAKRLADRMFAKLVGR